MPRKRLPKEIKEARGTLQNCRENSAAPTRNLNTPPMPASLSTQAQVYWPQYVADCQRMMTLSSEDWAALSLLCETHAEVARLEATHRARNWKTSYETVGRDGATMQRAWPDVAQLSDARRRLQSLLSEFGLTPAARSKVSARELDQEANPFQALLNG